jgi:hypothetical protein
MALTDETPPTSPKTSSTLQKMVPFTAVGVLIAAMYAGWTLYSRHESNVQSQRDLETRQEEKRQHQASQIFGGGEIRFLNFSSDAAVLKRGKTAQLCYGVVNAKGLTLDPSVEPVKPSASHCLEIAPKKTTTYTLTADDGAGHKKTVSLQVRVE